MTRSVLQSPPCESDFGLACGAEGLPLSAEEDLTARASSQFAARRQWQRRGGNDANYVRGHARHGDNSSSDRTTQILTTVGTIRVVRSEFGYDHQLSGRQIKCDATPGSHKNVLTHRLQNCWQVDFSAVHDGDVISSSEHIQPPVTTRDRSPSSVMPVQSRFGSVKISIAPPSFLPPRRISYPRSGGPLDTRSTAR